MDSVAGERRLELSEVEKLTTVARTCTAGPDSVRPEGEYYVAIDPNSFGLPAVETCPGSTDYCEQDCYAIDSEYRPATYQKLMRNLEILKNDETVEAMAQRVRELVTDYKIYYDKLQITNDKQFFRIHWDGDFFSTNYASAWRIVIEENPDIKFLAYTRSFQPEVNVIPILAGIENLDLFLSVDRQNVERAAEVTADNPSVRVAYLVDYYEEADELIEKMGRGKEKGFRNLACPENMRDDNGNRKLPVISEKGGACARCTYCINKPESWDVVFVKKGYLFRAQNELPFVTPVPVEILPRKRKNKDAVQPIGSLAVETAQGSLL